MQWLFHASYLALQPGRSDLNTWKYSWFRAWPKYLGISLGASDWSDWSAWRKSKSFTIRKEMLNYSISHSTLLLTCSDLSPFAHLNIYKRCAVWGWTNPFCIFLGTWTRSPAHPAPSLHFSSPQRSHHTVTGNTFLRSTLSLSGDRRYIIYPTFILGRAEWEAIQSCTGCCSINQFTVFVCMGGIAGARE